MCVSYAALTLLWWVLIRYLSDRWWPATVIEYAPRWPFLLPLLVVLPLGLRRGWRMGILPLLTGLFVLGPLLNFNIPWRRWLSAAPEGQKLRVLTCNIHRLELNIAEFDAYLLAADPNIVVLQDYSGWDDSAVLRSGWSTYRVGEIFVASRFPIVGIHDLQLESVRGIDDDQIPHRMGAAAAFDLRTPAGLVTLVDLHLASPHNGLETVPADRHKGIFKLKANAIRRRNESAKITQWADAQTGPVILAGDFNTPPESPIYRAFWSRYRDAFDSAAFGYGYSYYAPVSAIRIDHILAGPGVMCAGCRIGPACGSPHRPVVADLVIAGGS